MRGRHAEEHALGRSIVVWRAFSIQVGQEQWRLRLLGGAESLRASDQFGHRPRRHARQPMQAGRRRQDHAHLMPLPGQAVAEGMNTLLRIGGMMGRGGKQHA